MTSDPFVPTQEPFFNNGSLLIFTLDAVKLPDGQPAKEIEYRGVRYSYVTHNPATKDVTYRQAVT